MNKECLGTHTPVPVVVPHDGRGVEIQIFQIEISFDIVGEVFVGSLTAKHSEVLLIGAE